MKPELGLFSRKAFSALYLRIDTHFHDTLRVELVRSCYGKGEAASSCGGKAIEEGEKEVRADAGLTY
jgi:hypothetical protein